MISKETAEGVVTLTINRPDKANALTAEMLGTLADHVEAASEDPNVKVLMLTGTGKVFSSGADLGEVGKGLSTDPLWERLSGAIAHCPVLTITVLNGTVAGGAIGMILATDLRIATPIAKVFYPVIKLGFLPQPSDPGRLAAIVGSSNAKRILLTGAVVSGEEALAMGLFDRLENMPMEAALEMLKDTLAADRSHVAGIKALFP
ncbi:MAG: enoyl-CoA hydratase/isomerase family protein [Silicimonas sp.]|nr:enoyl-CoA hydratase/isomerase family protein [Silicimonas sp.]